MWIRRFVFAVRGAGFVYLLVAFLGCSKGVFYVGGAAPTAAPEPPLSLLWQQKMDAPPLGAALFSGSLALQLSTSATLYAFDRHSGERVGKRGLDGEVCGAPAVVGDLVLIAGLGKDAAMIALDRRTQKERWRHEGTFCLPPAVRNDTVVGAGEDGALHALLAESGEKIWQVELVDERLRVAPVISGNLLLVGTARGRLYALDMADGEERWQRELDSGVRTTPLVADGRIWVGSATGRIASLELESGRRLWTSELGALPAAGLALTQGILVVGAVDRNVYGLDAESGEEVWRFETEGVVRSSPAATRTTVYCASSDGHLYALMAATGRLLWKFRLEGPVLEPVAIGGDVVVVATEKKMLYAFGRR